MTAGPVMLRAGRLLLMMDHDHTVAPAGICETDDLPGSWAISAIQPGESQVVAGSGWYQAASLAGQHTFQPDHSRDAQASADHADNACGARYSIKRQADHAEKDQEDIDAIGNHQVVDAMCFSFLLLCYTLA